ncbi:MAG TPA: Fic family protein [Puia sp.]|jgi:Fic family protein|nr:Fic family protein [Puia sp.]
MSFREKIAEIDRLQQSIEQHGKLGWALLQKINYKFRLDWNYYSNRMEGNTLTLDETKSVMIGNINVHNKPLKDVMEMKGHDEVVQMILKMGKGELNISESRIKQLHEEIMYEESPTEKAKISEWKTQSNHMINYREEKFDFTDPAEVKEKMHVLVNWVNAEKEKIETKKKGALHPVELAFEFHLRYLTIHPFYDGNGRTARILTNLILISYGYPPIYIKDNEKQFYYRYLADVQGYGAGKNLLFELMSDYLVRSLNLVADAIAGKEIEEPEDLDKKIQLLERELSAFDPSNEVTIKFSKKELLSIYDAWLADLIKAAIGVIEKFNKFFMGQEHAITLSKGAIFERTSNKPISAFIEELKRKITDSTHLDHAPIDMYIQAQYRHFVKAGLREFDCFATIKVTFGDVRYELFVDDFDVNSQRSIQAKQFERLLHQPLSQKEMTEVANKLGNIILKQIDIHTKKK